MDVDKILNLIILVIGKENVSREQRSQLKTLLSLVMKTDYKANDYRTVKPAPVRKKNELDTVDSDTVPLNEATFFNIPKGELNLEVEGETEPRKVMITPTGSTIN